MTLVDIALVRKQALSKLGADPRGARYTDAIGEDADFTVLTELTDNALIVDGVVVGDIIGSAGHPARVLYMLPQVGLAHGDFLPAHTGAHGDVQVSVSGVYDFSVPAKSKEEILRMRKLSTLYGGTSRHHFIEDNVVFHAGDLATVWYPLYTKTSTCQSPQIYTDVVVYGTLAFSKKLDMDEGFYGRYEALFELGRQLVRGQASLIPAQQELEAVIAARRKENVR